MSETGPLDEKEQARRRILVASTIGMGTVGLAATAIPFVASMEPSERAKAEAAPVDVDVTRVAPGTLITVNWRGRPVWVLHRTPQMLATLGKHDALLLDPDSQTDQQPKYARNATRSVRPAFLVVEAVCTHLGCIPVFRPEPGAADLGPDWPGGFYCPCHGSKYDLAGRVFRNVPAPVNLAVPPHAYHGERLVIGEEGPGVTT
ncbi:ubiquinol-cytochrome c reductase iron-sulfur subunit [Massilia solisilvae]|uniref:Ubiquinol-cytochrome c reductase iron-sulfur subunit n=1 Tax=Massilia solisilvae TaxID=1811225 RepID=A0ABT2BPN1_9BURK|nr:ubiquinol-cytochrome c reductase iron-sulfur subunit [Massilia solisilvae]MCS0610468.1 ubiquinol-cytochrome c reductase iron-sulfur subunit [Massilia solisilvae]